MSNTELWKYSTSRQEEEMLLALGLLGDCDWSDARQLACLYALSNETDKHYYSCTLAKRDGGQRRLLVPDALLKRVQRNILHQVLDKLPYSPYATAYHPGAGIRQNALQHVGRKRLLKLDIKQFFDHIDLAMVYRWAFPAVYFPPAVRGLLSHLCCYRNHLPQGAPTSPAISNLVLKSFDEQLGAWCQIQGISYSRYCDDLAFSGDFSVQAVKRQVKQLLSVRGFALNPAKTQTATSGQQQKVCGVVVNEKPQVERSYRRRLRQILYYGCRFGLEEHLRHIGDAAYLQEGRAYVGRYARHLLGQVNFVLQIDPADQEFQEAAQWLKTVIAAE